MLIKYRFVKEGNSLYTESIRFNQNPNGFPLPGEEGTWKIISIASPAFDYTTIPTSDPYQIPVRPNVVILTPEEYQTEKDNREQQKQQEIQDAKSANEALPPVGIDFTNDDKIFLIDYYGPSYKIPNSDRRKWFNVVYRFDPVDDDPRITG